MAEATTEDILRTITNFKVNLRNDKLNCGLANYIIKTTNELKQHSEFNFNPDEIIRDLEYTIEEIKVFNPELQHQFYSFVLRYLIVDKTDNSIGYEHFPCENPSEASIFYIKTITDNIRERFAPLVRIRQLAREIIKNK